MNYVDTVLDWRQDQLKWCHRAMYTNSIYQGGLLFKPLSLGTSL